MPKSVGGITWPKHMHAQSQFCKVKIKVTPMLFISTICYSSFSMDKKRSLRNEKLKVNRDSETEEQRKERLKIRHEKKKTTTNSAWPLSKY